MSLQIADHLVGNTHIRSDDVPDRRVLPAGRLQFEERQAQPLLEDVDGADRVAAGHEAADVVLMRDRRRPALDLPIDEDRPDHIDVRQMLTGRQIGIVEDEEIPLGDPALGHRDQVLHRVEEATQMKRGREALRQGVARRVANGG